MKKHILIISIVVLIVSFFVSCSVNSSIDEVATTAVTDSQGTTHYYQPVTDENGEVSTTGKNQGVFAEIETQSNGKTVTNKNGAYVTNEHTTVLPIENGLDNTIKSESEKISSDTTKDIDNDDNIVEFEPTDTTNETKPNTTTTENNKTTQSATDKDGWINKWY